jgi:hypothetical protein
MNKTTQNATVRALLESGGSLTSITAQHYGIMRLAARVHEVNESIGWPQIVGVFVNEGGKRVKQYRSVIIRNSSEAKAA